MGNAKRCMAKMANVGENAHFPFVQIVFDVFFFSLICKKVYFCVAFIRWNYLSELNQ